MVEHLRYLYLVHQGLLTILLAEGGLLTESLYRHLSLVFKADPEVYSGEVALS